MAPSTSSSTRELDVLVHSLPALFVFGHLFDFSSSITRVYFPSGFKVASNVDEVIRMLLFLLQNLLDQTAGCRIIVASHRMISE
jgi:hypothetical protein